MGSSQQGRFRYERLPDPKTYIRVISIHSGSEDGLLRCQLEHHLLDHRPYYVALSYEWGDPDVEVETRINNELSYIRHNLWLLLQHLLVRKTRLVESQQFRLWADAICIDQKNLQEKADQIHLMSDIFWQADSVLAWLGWTTGPTAGLKLTALAYFGTTPEPVNDKRGCAQRLVSYLETLRRYDAQPQLQALTRLLQSSYWSRRWVVQELLLARDFTVIFDLEERPWFEFAIFFERLSDLDTSMGRTSLHAEHQHLLSMLHDIMETMPYKIWSWHKWAHQTESREGSLVGLLREFRNTFCEFDLDKIYSLLSLILGGNEIPVDYDCSREQLLSRFFSPLHHQKFDPVSFKKLAAELRSTLQTVEQSDSTYTRPHSFVECAFHRRDLDKIMLCNVPLANDMVNKIRRDTWGNDEEENNLMKNAVMNWVRFQKSSGKLKVLLKFSYVGRLTKSRQAVEARGAKQPSTGTDDRGKRWVWCVSNRGYVACCSPEVSPGDLICPLTREYGILVRIDKGQSRIVGQAYKQSLLHFDRKITVAPLRSLTQFEEDRLRVLHLSINRRAPGVIVKARTLQQIIERNSQLQRPLPITRRKLTLQLEISELFRLTQCEHKIRRRFSRYPHSKHISTWLHELMAGEARLSQDIRIISVSKPSHQYQALEFGAIHNDSDSRIASVSLPPRIHQPLKLENFNFWSDGSMFLVLVKRDRLIPFTYEGRNERHLLPLGAIHILVTRARSPIDTSHHSKWVAGHPAMVDIATASRCWGIANKLAIETQPKSWKVR